MQLEDEMGRVIDALAAGHRVSRDGEGWRLGRSPVPLAVIDALVTHGLVAVEGRSLLIAPAGRRWRPAGATNRRRLAQRPLAPAAAGKAAAGSVTVNLAENPLGWLRARGLVSARQFAAGERIGADWARAQLAPHVTMRWDPSPHAPAHGPAEPLDATAAQLAAKRRFDAAIAAAGPGLSDVLWRVACAGEGLEAAERALGWPGRSGKVVLGIALDRVADHYRLPGDA